MSIPLFQVIGEIFLNEERCLQYLIDQGVVTVPIFCTECGNEGLGHPSLKMYQCKKKYCRKKQSIYNGTFFFNSKIPCHLIMHAAYKFLNKESSSSIVRQLGIDKKTAAAWLGFFRYCKDIAILIITI